MSTLLLYHNFCCSSITLTNQVRTNYILDWKNIFLLSSSIHLDIVFTHMNTGYMFVRWIYWFISGWSVEAQRNGFVLVNVCIQRALCSWTHPPTAPHAEQHCGIGYRRKASRKTCKDDGECASFCSPNSSAQSAPIHQISNDYLHRDIPRCYPSTLLPLGWKYFAHIRVILLFIATMLARWEKPASLGVYNANGDAG